MEYFVSFMRTSAPGHMGFSDAVLTVGGPMTADVLGEVRAFIESQYPGEQIAIISFQPLHTPTQDTATV